MVVREGKGQKDRVVPIGERAIAWLEKYLDEARPEFVVEPDEGTVFLTRRGRPFLIAGPVASPIAFFEMLKAMNNANVDFTRDLENLP